jgi:phosphate transport system ATP-binding protein
MENLVMETPEQTVMERLEQGSVPSPDAPIPRAHTFEVRNMSIWYGEKRAIENVTLDIVSNAVTAIIGPSGC